MTRLAKLMSEKDLTDRALAEMVSAPEVEIWRLRKGPHNRGQKMTSAWARRLAAALDVDWNELLDEDARREEVARSGEAASEAPKKPGRQAAKSVAVYVREQEPLSRDDLRIMHGIVSACALASAPNVQLSAEAFRNLVQRAIENAAYGPSDLSALTDRIASWLTPGER